MTRNGRRYGGSWSGTSEPFTYGAHPDLLSMKLNPNAVDEAERQRAETFLKHAVDEASYLGARGMAFLAGKWEEKTKERRTASF